MHLGPFRRVIFPYEFHFKAINTHILLPSPLTGEVASDKKMIYASLSKGNCFVGYDLPAPTRGFRFTAQGHDADAIMGDEIPAKGGITLQVRTPHRLISDCSKTAKSFKDGKIKASQSISPVSRAFIASKPTEDIWGAREAGFSATRSMSGNPFGEIAIRSRRGRKTLAEQIVDKSVTGSVV